MTAAGATKGMRLGWKVFIPLTLAWICATALMAYYGVFEVGA